MLAWAGLRQRARQGLRGASTPDNRHHGRREALATDAFRRSGRIEFSQFACAERDCGRTQPKRPAGARTRLHRPGGGTARRQRGARAECERSAVGGTRCSRIGDLNDRPAWWSISPLGRKDQFAASRSSRWPGIVAEWLNHLRALPPAMVRFRGTPASRPGSRPRSGLTRLRLRPTSDRFALLQPKMLVLTEFDRRSYDQLPLLTRGVSCDSLQWDAGHQANLSSVG